jgi:uncharacterized protein YndB with AHSA1/START domain
VSDPLVLTQHIAAPPQVVFTYLTESAKWAQWQGSDAKIEPRPGGEFVMRMPDGAMATGEFIELIPDRRVVFTWGWNGHAGLPPGSSTVEIDVLPVDGGTLVRLTHRDLPDDERKPHRTGWERYLPRLAAVARGERVDPDRSPDG